MEQGRVQESELERKKTITVNVLAGNGISSLLWHLYRVWS